MEMEKTKTETELSWQCIQSRQVTLLAWQAAAIVDHLPV